MNSSRVRFHVSSGAMAEGHFFFSLKAFCNTSFGRGEGLHLERFVRVRAYFRNFTYRNA